MRRHYESLNYLDGQPNNAKFRFARTQGQETGLIASVAGNHLVSFEEAMSRGDVRELRDMLNEVLEDWQ